MKYQNVISQKMRNPKEAFKNEDGAIDLASIMVGIIVIGLIGGVIAATVFAVIPWTQDNAAKQQLDSVVAAESAYMGLASSVPPGTPAGHAPNSYADSAKLAEANLMNQGTTYCATVTDGGQGYSAFSQSSSGKIWSVSSSNTKPEIFTGTLPTDCEFIRTSGASASATPAATATPTPTPTATTPPVNTFKAIDGSSALWSYEAPGNTTLGARTTVNSNGTAWSGVAQLISVDWTGDGNLDLIARWNSGKLTMHEGTANANEYKAPLVLGEFDWEKFDLTVTKFKKTDTYPGIIARGKSDGNLYYYPNYAGTTLGANGGTFKTMIGNGGWTVMSEISALDWDKDGDMDLLVRNSSGELITYYTDGAGNFINGGGKVDFGWGIMDHIAAEPNFAGPGTVGLMARTTGGELRYYPIVDSAIKPATIVATSGWTGYVMAEGSPTLP